MISLLSLVLVGVALLVAYATLPILLEPLLTPLKRIPGPPSPSWFWGNLKQSRKASPGSAHVEWIEKYGHVTKYKLLFGLDRLLTTDPKAVNHILTHSADYQKPDHTRSFLLRLFGEGLLFAEGEVHRRQRRILNPAFGLVQIRGLTDIFFQKSLQLRDIWVSTINNAGAGDVARINVLSGLTNMTLDVIGLAGFDYDFDALNPNGKPNPLGQAMTEVLSSGAKPSVMAIIQAFIPILQYIPTMQAKKMNSALRDMRRIGAELVAQKKAAILATSRSTKGEPDVSKEDVEGRDLLTLLIKANLASDIPESHRLSDEDVIAQIPTFFIAGHETTAGAVTWCLYALSQNKDAQRKLREELLSVETDTLSMDDLMALPYLDNVLRETLRVHPPVTNSIRQATKDDFIPLSKPYTDVYGEVHHFVQVRAGDRISIPIFAINRSKELWGVDADEFKPERWDDPPEAISSVPGVWGHILSFLGGPRACIGYRFSLVEFKALVFTLIRTFEFDLAVLPEDILKKSYIVTRPVVKSEPEKGNQMPMLIRPYRR